MSKSVSKRTKNIRMEIPIEERHMYKFVTTKYAEDVAKIALDNIEKLRNIPVLSMRGDYKVNHATRSKDFEEDTAESNRVEEQFCKSTYTIGECLKYFGKIVDYQVPLKTPKQDNTKYHGYNEGLGKLDLLTLNDHAATILEVKLAVARNPHSRHYLKYSHTGKYWVVARILHTS